MELRDDLSEDTLFSKAELRRADFVLTSEVEYIPDGNRERRERERN